jgi:hypothetical protein
LEVVDRADVVGVVQAVYRSDGARMRRIDSVLFRARGAAFAYLQPLRASYQRTAPHRRERTYRLLVQAAAGLVRSDARAVLRAAEQASPWRFASMARRHDMTDVLDGALAALNGDPHAGAVRVALRRVQRSHIPPRRTEADYPTLREIFVLANGGALSTQASPAVLLLAAQLRGLPSTADASTRRLAAWMVQREDLPEPLRARSECIDAWFAADRYRAAAFIAAALRQETLRAGVARVASAAAIAVYLRFMR